MVSEPVIPGNTSAKIDEMEEIHKLEMLDFDTIVGNNSDEDSN